MARWTVAPGKTDTAMVHTARGLAWSWAASSTLVNRLADWLSACGVDTVAMESTGVCWIPLFELLGARGFNVLPVDARHFKNVSGRESDVLDCQ